MLETVPESAGASQGIAVRPVLWAEAGEALAQAPAAWGQALAQARSALTALERPLDLAGLDGATALAEVRRLAAGPGFLLLLAGSAQVGLAAAQARRALGEPVGLVHLGASPGMRRGFGREASEAGLPLVGVGWRAFSPVEYEYWRRRRIKAFPARLLQAEPDWPELVTAWLPEAVYLVLDLDALDPAVFAAAARPEPGGLTVEALERFLARLFAGRRVAGATLTGLAAPPLAERWLKAAARLAIRVAGLALGQVGAAAFRRGEAA